MNKEVLDKLLFHKRRNKQVGDAQGRRSSIKQIIYVFESVRAQSRYNKRHLKRTPDLK